MSLNSAKIAVLAIPLATAWGVGACCANDAIPSAAAGVPETPHPPKMLILYDGKVIEGAIRFAQGGYEVAAPGGGRVFFANEFVWFGTESLPSAYEQLRERLPDQTANGHTVLADWCVKNGLVRQAEDELKIALQLEPDHQKARETLKALDAMLHGGSSSATTSETKRAAAEVPLERSERPTIVPSDSSMKHFVSRIQPILVNRCGNAACHGTTSGNKFSLKNVRVGNPAYRAFSEYNLQATKPFISPDQPEASPLLLAPQQPGHGGSHRPVYAGPGGDAHLQDLAAWVAAMAETMPRKASFKSPIASDASLDLETKPVAAAPSDNASGVVPAAAESSAADPAGDLLKRILKEERPDAFDPEIFNRQFAPRSSEPSPSSIDGPTR